MHHDVDHAELIKFLFDVQFSIESITEAYETKISLRKLKGIDRMSSKAFDKIKKNIFVDIHRKVMNGTYNFSPYLEILKLKSRGKPPRVISIPTIRDAITLHLLKDFLHKVFPEYIQHKLPNTIIKEISDFAKHADIDNLKVFKIDIKGFYDNINHEILFKVLKTRIACKLHLSLISRAIRNITVAQHYHRNDYRGVHNKKGVPQGLAISNILAEIYINSFDEFLKRRCVQYFRFVDDMVLFYNKDTIEINKDSVKEGLDNLRLSFNEEKTNPDCSNFEFDYLGYKFAFPKITVKEATREKFIKVLINDIHSYRHSIPSLIKSKPWLNRKLLNDIFVSQFNERITGAISSNRKYGWIFYYNAINDLHILYQIDSILSKVFSSLKEFDHVPPPGLKKLSRAYFESKYNLHGGYVRDFNKYTTTAEKMRFLTEHGYFDPASVHGLIEEEVESMFKKVIFDRLSRLERDIGLIS